MYRQIILILGTLISLGALITTLFLGGGDNSDAFERYSAQEKEAVLSPVSERKINYTTTKPTAKKTTNTTVATPKKARHQYLAVAKTSDSKYALSLDSDNESYLKNSTGMVPLYGKIEGKRFKMMVPKNVVNNFADDVTLNVRNVKTGVTQSVSASFIGEMVNGQSTYTDSIDIPDGNNLSDYQHNQENSILPPL